MDAPTTVSPTLKIRPWIDPLVDDDGHDPRSRYVERFWLGILGPTATWLIRRLVAELDTHPDGFDLDLAATAQAMGLGFTVGKPSPFTRALQRCTMFGLAHAIPGGIAVRRRLPPVAHRHLRRMPVALQTAHQEWVAAEITLDELTRAHALAHGMIEAGDEPEIIEHQLVSLGVADPVAALVAANALELSAPMR